MHIKLSNRVYPLTIPVERRGKRMPLKEKKISYQEDWRRQHWNSLISAYKNSPYFEYYAEPIRITLYRSPIWLMDLHMELLDLMVKWLTWEGDIHLSEEYFPSEYYDKDFRKDFDASLNTLPPWFQTIPYPQVFDGFHEGLSMLDLLFNEGPVARGILLKSFKEEPVE